MSAPVVVKLGSNLVVDTDGAPRLALLRSRAAELAEIVGGGRAVCVVSSGAIALGLTRLGLERRPRSLPKLQAASALGQAMLQRLWDDALGTHGLQAAQVLLTGSEIADRRAYVNVRNALEALCSANVVPVVNENDATATDEISFGDNDALAAQVAVLVRAPLLILLTTAPGVLTRSPGSKGARLIADGSEARTAAFGTGSAAGRGGMESKVGAAELAAAAGIPTVIASGEGDGVLPAIVRGEAHGTRFKASAESLPAFKLWLRYGKRIAGALHVDDGARQAVRDRGRSLLAVGITGWDGTFKAGDGVDLVGPDGVAFARGIVSVDAADLSIGAANVEAVHRDRLVLLPPTV